MAGPEFGGFGGYTVAVGSMLLTHPERLVSINDLWIDVAGDEFAGADGSFGRAPFFDFDDGGVGFGTDWVVSPCEDCGSASLFLPQ